jgi:hypothetical protein
MISESSDVADDLPPSPEEDDDGEIFGAAVSADKMVVVT